MHLTWLIILTETCIKMILTGNNLLFSSFIIEGKFVNLKKSLSGVKGAMFVWLFLSRRQTLISKCLDIFQIGMCD